MSQDRREFLGTLMAAGLAPGVMGSTLSGDRPNGAVQSAPFDLTWPNKITGKYRAVFDSVEISMGLGLIRALIWIKDYADMYGAKPAEMSPVVVLRHNAIWQIMNDEFWAHHGIGKLTGIADPATRAPITRNPVMGANPFGLPAALADDSLRRVMAAGTVLACNLAFTLDVVEKIKQDEKLDDAKAREMAIRHIVPGVLLQPSGVFAALRAQEAGCHYLLATGA